MYYYYVSLQLSGCSSLDSVAEGDSSNSGHGHHHHHHGHGRHHPPPGGLHFAKDLQQLSKMFINASMLPRPKSESNFRVKLPLITDLFPEQLIMADKMCL